MYTQTQTKAKVASGTKYWGEIQYDIFKINNNKVWKMAFHWKLVGGPHPPFQKKWVDGVHPPVYTAFITCSRESSMCKPKTMVRFTIQPGKKQMIPDDFPCYCTFKTIVGNVLICVWKICEGIKSWHAIALEHNGSWTGRTLLIHFLFSFFFGLPSLLPILTVR